MLIRTSVIVVSLLILGVCLLYLVRICRLRSFEKSDPPIGQRTIWPPRNPVKEAPMNWWGHPQSPLKAMRKSLPTPPTDYRWESRVLAYVDGRQRLHVSLFSLITGESVAERVVDLVEMQPGRTWAAEYRAYPDLLVHIFDTELVDPIVDWAKVQCHIIAPPPDEYEMGP